jgi:uncharacterized peroxidase-related enzyme
MTRDAERGERASEQPIVGSLPDAPGIGVAMRLTPGLGMHLRGLADELLVHDFPGATIARHERELLATAVSAANDCFFCMDSHAAHAGAVATLEGSAAPSELDRILEGVKDGRSDGVSPKLAALLDIARTVRRSGRSLTSADVAAATAAGASDGDVQLAVLIAAAFSMYNRLVDGFRARTAPSTAAYAERASEIAERGYAAPSMVAPGAPGGGRAS